MKVKSFARSALYLFAVSLLPASSARAEPLWQTFDVGAAKEAVLSAVPSAKLDAANSGGGVEEYRAEGVPEAGMWTYLTFSGGLRRVKMYGRGADSYLRVVESLTKKYGKPSSTSQAASSGLSVWKRKSSEITAKLEQSYNMGAGFVAREPFTVTYAAGNATPLDHGL